MLKIGKLPNDDQNMLNEESKELYKQMLDDVNSYSFYGKLSLFDNVLMWLVWWVFSALPS